MAGMHAGAHLPPGALSSLRQPRHHLGFRALKVQHKVAWANALLEALCLCHCPGKAIHQVGCAEPGAGADLLFQQSDDLQAVDRFSQSLKSMDSTPAADH